MLTAGAKAGWQLLWQTFMQELAPQSKDGEYSRPSYGLRGTIGSPDFPVSPPVGILGHIHTCLPALQRVT